MPNEWEEFTGSTTMVGDAVEGRVVNVTDFGLFVDIYEGLEGLAHISEIDIPGGRLEDHYVVGKWVRARVLRIDEEDHKVGLTMRGVAPLTSEESDQLEGAYQEKQAEAGATFEMGDAEAPSMSTPVDDGAATLGDLASLQIKTVDAPEPAEAPESEVAAEEAEEPAAAPEEEAAEVEASASEAPAEEEPAAEPAVEAAATEDEAETAEGDESEGAAEEEKE